MLDMLDLGEKAQLELSGAADEAPRAEGRNPNPHGGQQALENALQ